MQHLWTRWVSGHINKSISCLSVSICAASQHNVNLFVPGINALGLCWCNISVADPNLMNCWPGGGLRYLLRVWEITGRVQYLLYAAWTHKGRTCVQSYLLRYLFWCVALLSAPALFFVTVDVWLLCHSLVKCFVEGIGPTREPLCTISRVKCVRTHTFLCLLCYHDGIKMWVKGLQWNLFLGLLAVCPVVLAVE